MEPDIRSRRRRWRVAALIPIQFAWLALIYGGLRVITLGSPATGALLLAAGGITAYLALRRLIVAATDRGDTDPGEFRGPEFDYVVWTAIGLPVLMVLAVLIMVLTGDLR
jgi:hypothetical protein